ncbi:phage tail protein [Pseudomonas sp. LF090]
MIDPNSQFFAILTAVGEAKQANADALGIPWKLTELGVGDANGTDPIPDRAQTKLINERRRRPLNKLSVDTANSNIIVAEQIIPADEGGWWIREIGLYDSDGALVAVANCAPSYKPLMSQGSGRTQVVRMNFIVSSAANVVLKIDPAVVLATRQYVDETTADAINRQDAKQSVLVATTGPIQLAGSPTIDGVVVPLGSRVLVKDQAQAKDNGIYLTADIWKRATDADSSAKVTPGLLVGVEQGAVNADTLWLLSTDGAIVLGTTALIFKGVTQGLAPISSPAFTDVPTAPTPPRFDSSNRLATTASVQRSLGSFAGSRGISAATQLTVADVGCSIGLGGTTTYTVTLPDVADAPAGSTIGLHCRNAAGITIASKTGTQISPQGGYLSTIAMSAGESATLVREGSIWVVYGLAALKYSQLVAASTGDIGFMKHPCGMIEQWGSGTTDSNGNVYVTFPIAWPTALRNIGLLHLGTAGLMGCVVSPTKTGCTLRVQNDQAIASANWFVYWRALGI